MTRYIRSDDELIHWGRSKRDGAPGVGTGNWRRQGGVVDITSLKSKSDSEKREKRETNKKALKAKVNKALTQNIKGGKDKPNISPAEKVAKDTKNIVDETSNITKTLADLKRMRNKEDLSSISDEELRARINRLNMEVQYDNLTSKNTQNGYDKATEILSVVGSVVGIVGSTVAIAATVHNWNK